MACSTFGQYQEDSLLLGPTHYSSSLCLFSGIIPIRFKDIYVNKFFPRLTRLQNSLPVICLSSTNYPNGWRFILSPSVAVAVQPVQKFIGGFV